MAYEWFDDIESIVYGLEAQIESAASARSIGVAPSAGDEARKRLRAVAAARSPRDLVLEAESVDSAAVEKASKALAADAVKRAAARGSRHVTREDVAAAVDAGGVFPYLRKK